MKPRRYVRIQEVREYDIMFEAGTTQSLEQAKSDALELALAGELAASSRMFDVAAWDEQLCDVCGVVHAEPCPERAA